MECSCEISADVQVYSTILSERWIAARKTHVCGECSERISPGEKYYKEHGLDDARVFTHKTCADCISIRANLCSDYFYGQIREMVEEAIWDCEGQLPEKCIAKLTPGAREWVCDVIEDVWWKEGA